MGRQYNKVEKRKRKSAYSERLKERTKKKASPKTAKK